MLRRIAGIFRRPGPDDELAAALQGILGFRPKNMAYYRLALTHRSASLHDENNVARNNERLEFLGDAVLDEVMAEYLYLTYPDMPEGELTKLRSKYVSGTSLERFSGETGINRIITTRANIRQAVHLTGDAVEALIGAVMLDYGREKAKKFILERFLTSCLNNVDTENRDYNYKSEVIEWCQHKKLPFKFETSEDLSSTRNRQMFICTIKVRGAVAGVGFGNSKKMAEQMAARETLFSFQ